jgi:hypothetical protein
MCDAQDKGKAIQDAIQFKTQVENPMKDGSEKLPRKI